MRRKHVLSLATLLCCSAPSFAFDARDTGPGAMFYMELPLDGASRRDQVPIFGFSVQGREYRALNFDRRVLNALEAFGLGGVEAKWIAGGGAALLLLMGKHGGGGSSSPSTTSTTTPQTPAGGGTSGGGSTGGGGGGGGGCTCPTCGC